MALSADGSEIEIEMWSEWVSTCFHHRPPLPEAVGVSDAWQCYTVQQPQPSTPFSAHSQWWYCVVNNYTNLYLIRLCTCKWLPSCASKSLCSLSINLRFPKTCWRRKKQYDLKFRTCRSKLINICNSPCFVLIYLPLPFNQWTIFRVSNSLTKPFRPNHTIASRGVVASYLSQLKCIRVRYLSVNCQLLQRQILAGWMSLSNRSGCFC